MRISEGRRESDKERRRCRCLYPVHHLVFTCKWSPVGQTIERTKVKWLIGVHCSASTIAFGYPKQQCHTHLFSTRSFILHRHISYVFKGLHLKRILPSWAVLLSLLDRLREASFRRGHGIKMIEAQKWHEDNAERFVWFCQGVLEN